MQRGRKSGYATVEMTILFEHGIGRFQETSAELDPSASLLMTPIELRVEYRGIPHLAKNERDAPNFLHAALDKSACAPFFQGKAHEVCGTHETSQEIGDVGHPILCCRYRKPVI
jgi:hypothetical protein